MRCVPMRRTDALQSTDAGFWAVRAAEMGEDTLLDTLQTGAKRGIIYHYPGSLTGDYDLPGSEEGVRALLERLRGYPKN